MTNSYGNIIFLFETFLSYKTSSHYLFASPPTNTVLFMKILFHAILAQLEFNVSIYSIQSSSITVTQLKTPNSPSTDYFFILSPLITWDFTFLFFFPPLTHIFISCFQSIYLSSFLQTFLDFCLQLIFTYGIPFNKSFMVALSSIFFSNVCNWLHSYNVHIWILISCQNLDITQYVITGW